MHSSLKDRISVSFRHSYLFGHILAFCCGLLVGFKVLPATLVAITYCTVSVACFKYALDNNIPKLINTLPYIVYTEVYIRHAVLSIPYLFMNYLYIIIFFILLVRQRHCCTSSHSKLFFLLIIYFLLEFLDVFRTKDIEYARFLVISSLALTLCATWASYNYLSPKLLNRCFEHIKYAGIFLIGIITVAHIRGDIQYGLHSSSKASNGLAPVQLSAYLGFVSILFFFSIMNSKGKHIVTDIILFLLTSINMALTFSRGGLYFLGTVVFIYILLNRKQLKSYYLIIIAMPIVIFTYLFLISSTHGAIAERFEMEGTSGRDRLVQAGLIMFSEHPMIGIGTANYNKLIAKENLFEEEIGSHNEFIRSLAEHGLLGFFTYWLFYLILFTEILRRNSVQREYAIYFFVLYCMIIVHNGLKISLQPLLLIFVIATPSVIVRKKTKVLHLVQKQDF
jgi:O-antigen ligase